MASKRREAIRHRSETGTVRVATVREQGLVAGRGVAGRGVPGAREAVRTVGGGGAARLVTADDPTDRQFSLDISRTTP